MDNANAVCATRWRKTAQFPRSIPQHTHARNFDLGTQKQIWSLSRLWCTSTWRLSVLIWHIPVGVQNHNKIQLSQHKHAFCKNNKVIFILFCVSSLLHKYYAIEVLTNDLTRHCVRGTDGNRPSCNLQEVLKVTAHTRTIVCPDKPYCTSQCLAVLSLICTTAPVICRSSLGTHQPLLLEHLQSYKVPVIFKDEKLVT